MRSQRASLLVAAVVGVVIAVVVAMLTHAYLNRPAPQTPVIAVAPPGAQQTSPLTPKADAGVPGTVPNGSLPGSTPALIGDPQQVVVDGQGGAPVTWVTPVTFNPWTPQQAVAFAASSVRHQYEDVSGLCDHTAAGYDYGWLGSGYPSAHDHALSIPSKYRHRIKGNPPAGALVFWVGPNGSYGHVVLSNGDGRVYSNDILRQGHVDLVPISLFKSRWGMTFDFWSPPYTPNGFGRNPNPAPVVATPRPAPVPTAVSIGPRLNTGATLLPGQQLLSTNGRYHAVMQGDGNFTEYDGGRAMWSSRTNGHPGARLVQQTDGNTVIYQGSRPLWWTRTYTHANVWTQLNTDGALVVYRPPAHVLWHR